LANLKLTLPAELRELGNRISRSLEPDSGGYHVFDFCDNAVRDADGVIEIPATEVYATIPESERYSQRLMEHREPVALHAFVTEDYAARWQDETCPTLAECEAFCAALVMEVIE
jgi:hypothetical protein